MRLMKLLLFGLSAALVGCPSGVDGGADDDDIADDDDAAEYDCRGDALVADLPYSSDLDAFAARWNENSELLRILFVGEPL